MTRPHFAIWILSFFLTFPMTALSSGAKMIQKLVALETPRLESPLQTFFEEGTVTDAIQLSKKMAGAVDYFEDSFGVKVDLTVATLAPDRWKAISPFPYGIVFIAHNPFLAVFPSREDNIVTSFNRKLGKRLSNKFIQKIESSGLSYKKASHAFVQTVGFHEIGHAITTALSLNSRLLWFGEFLASYVGTLYMMEHSPNDLTIWNGFMASYTQFIQPNRRSIKEFETLYAGMGLENFLWYHGQFQKRAFQVARRKGRQFLIEVRKVFLECPQCTTDTNSLLTELEKISPGFLEWAKTFATHKSWKSKELNVLGNF